MNRRASGRSLAAAVLGAVASPTRRRRPTPPAPVGPAFSLSTSQAVTTRERAEIWLTFRQLASLDFRVYKVRDPLAFFAGLRDPHQFGTDEPLPVPQEPTLIERIASWKAAQRRQVRDFLRAQTTPAVPPGPAGRRRHHAGVAARARCRSAPSRRCRCSIPISWSARGASCCPTFATPRCGACRSTCPGPASTSSRPCTIGCAPTRSSSSRTSASSPRPRRARCCSSPPIATPANRAPACEARVLSGGATRGHRTHLGRRRPRRGAVRRRSRPSALGVGRVRRSRRHRRPRRVGVPAAAAASWPRSSTPTSRSTGPATPCT